MRQCSTTFSELLALVLLAAIAVGWIQNIIKLADCDFNSPYKAEVIHAAGLYPLIGMITGWMNVGR